MTATIKSTIIGAMIPSSLGIVLLFESSIKENKIDHITRVAIIAPKLNNDTFKNLTLIGTKKNIITTKHGTKNG